MAQHSKEPCKKEACDIQACLSKNNFLPQKHLDQYKDSHGSEVSQSHPAAAVLLRALPV